jgi:hypothetical protein
MPNRFAALVAAAIALVAAVVVSHRSTVGPTIAHPIGKLAPTPGPNADGYITAKRAYLSRLAAEGPDAGAAGLVSFARMLTPAEADQVLTGLDVSVAFVVLPGSTPEAPRVDTTILAAVVKREADLVAAEKAEVSALQAKRDPASGPLIADRRAQIAATTPDCACVYAAVVQKSTVGKLAALSRSGLVRLVDVPDPLTDDLSGWQLTPILPKTPA